MIENVDQVRSDFLQMSTLNRECFSINEVCLYISKDVSVPLSSSPKKVEKECTDFQGNFKQDTK